MIQHLFPVLWLIVFTSSAVAQSIGTAEVRPADPPKMFSYFATGMRVGIVRVDGTASFRLDVYTEEDHAVAVATTKLGHLSLATSAAETNPAIKRELDAYIKRNHLADDSTDRIRIHEHSKTTFGTIDAIGDDYLLIGLDKNVIVKPNFTQKRRLIIPKSFIGAVDLDASPVRFVAFPDRKSTQAR